MLSVSYAGKNEYSAGKTSGVLRGGASRAKRCYVLAHCGGEEGGLMDVMEMVEMKVVNVVLWVVGGCKLKSDPVLTVVQEKIFQVLRKCRGQ